MTFPQEVVDKVEMAALLEKAGLRKVMASRVRREQVAVLEKVVALGKPGKAGISLFYLIVIL